MTLKMQATRQKVRAANTFKAKTDKSINCKILMQQTGLVDEYMIPELMEPGGLVPMRNKRSAEDYD